MWVQSSGGGGVRVCTVNVCKMVHLYICYICIYVYVRIFVGGVESMCSK